MAYVVPQRRLTNIPPSRLFYEKYNKGYNQADRHLGFNGYITTAAIIISTTDALKNFANIYNSRDNSFLYDDHPHMVAAKSVQEIMDFERKASYDKTLDMAREEALKSTGKIRYGKNYVLGALVKRKLFDSLPNEYKLLCQILVPSSRKFPNIDIAFPTEKTESRDICYRRGDDPLCNTTKRCLREELGIDLDKCNNAIMTLPYQTGIRNEFGIKGIPYVYYLRDIKCYVLVVHPDDLATTIMNSQ